ncbi:MAG: hypothetical protein US12_C0009G0031 [Parcubacteria group bacterium GW2011_GWA2_36_24]|nr:MAG: hypothetical protein US12_C0009G0031 [Parcubacteria group bacterium GW2011_GWA2_36_24]
MPAQVIPKPTIREIKKNIWFFVKLPTIRPITKGNTTHAVVLT